MNAEPTTTEPPKWYDILPTRGGKHYALEWLPHSVDFEHGEGFAILTGPRDRTSYAVSMCNSPNPWLLSFCFTKVQGRGTDKTRESYIVTCSRTGTDAKCECKGWERWRWCKHADTLETLFANRWLTATD